MGEQENYAVEYIKKLRQDHATQLRKMSEDIHRIALEREAFRTENMQLRDRVAFLESQLAPFTDALPKEGLRHNPFQPWNERQDMRLVGGKSWGDK